MKEQWKNIPNYIDYQASNLGRIKSLKFNKERILKPAINSSNYLCVGLSKKGKVILRTIHQLVAETFLNHKPNGHNLVINHINFNKKDNKLKNIEIVSHRINSSKRKKEGLSKYTGVTWCKTKLKWKASIYLNSKSKNLGSFDNELDAHLSYKKHFEQLNK